MLSTFFYIDYALANVINIIYLSQKKSDNQSQITARNENKTYRHCYLVRLAF